MTPANGLTEARHRLSRLVPALGITQIFAWGSTYYLPAVLAAPIAAETSWPLALVIGGLSLGLLVAGLVSPAVGRAIRRNGGRMVLSSSSLILAVGLVLLAVAPGIFVYLAAWTVLGVAMGMGLYDAAFATLGREHGEAARSAITAVTLIAGFSSTITWPLSAALVEHFGWRGAVLFYAVVQLVVALPLHLVFVPRGVSLPSETAPREASGRPAELPPRDRRLFLTLATAIVLTAAIGAVVSVHLVRMLEGLGLTLATAVTIAALVGPSQVGARLIELGFGRRYHPLWTLVASMPLIAVGLALLLLQPPFLAVGVVLYGGGIGIGWVARGTVPLALFSREDYPVVIGRLGLPGMISQAVAPTLVALSVSDDTPQMLVIVLAVLGLLGVGLASALLRQVLAVPSAR